MWIPLVCIDHNGSPSLLYSAPVLLDVVTEYVHFSTLFWVKPRKPCYIINRTRDSVYSDTQNLLRREEEFLEYWNDGWIRGGSTLLENNFLFRVRNSENIMLCTIYTNHKLSYNWLCTWYDLITLKLYLTNECRHSIQNVLKKGFAFITIGFQLFLRIRHRCGLRTGRIDINRETSASNQCWW
jgi:hypothetical protein